MPLASPREEIASSIGRTLAEETRRNELRISYVRAAALALAAPLDWMGYLHPAVGFDYPRLSLQQPLVSSAWLAACAVLLLQLRRGWYRPWLPRVTPLFDGLLIGSAFFSLMQSAGKSAFASASLPGMAVVCSLLAISGGFRFRPSTAVLTTVLAMVIFDLLGALAGAPAGALLYVPAFLVAAGAMGYGTSQLVRGLLEGQIARATVERFLPDQVMRGAYGDPLSLLAQPRTVEATVLVSDLRGFTALSETLSPVEVLEFLNEIQGEFAAVVRRNGGTVDKFMGDGMLAVFGAPQPLPDHAAHAVRAALDIRAAMARVNGQRAGRGLRPVGCGIGVHSGPVVTGCLGSGERLEFTVIGDTVNTASRLESLTKEKGVDLLVSDETVARAPGTAGLKGLGEVSLRGRREPLRIHTLAA